MAEIKKYVGQDALGALVAKIKSGDAASLQSAKDYADGLASNYDATGSAASAEANAKAYADSLAVNYDAAGSAAAVQGKLDEEVTRATGKEAELLGLIEATDAIADKNAEDIAAIKHETTGILALAKADATEKANAVQGEVDALEQYVGTIPETAEATNIVAYVQEKTSGIATDTALEELTGRVAQAETDIDNIEKDYLKAADKTELEGKITSEQTRAEGIEAGLRTDVDVIKGDYLKAADKTELVGAIATAKAEAIATVLGEGVDEDFDTLKEVAEWILSDTTGAAALQKDVATLKNEMDAVEADVEQAQKDIDALEEAVATKAEAQALTDAVAALEGADSGLAGRISALEAKHGNGEGTVESLIATAKQEAIDAAAGDATTKANTAESNAKSHADGLNTAMNTRVEALEAIDHEHSNKAELDLIVSGDKAKWDAAEAKAHEHGNKAELDKIVEGDKAKWDAAEQNAKTYADGLNTAMTTKVDGIDGRVTANAEAIATKAAASDLTALAERVTTAEEGIAANKSAIESFVAITSAEIDALFA